MLIRLRAFIIFEAIRIFLSETRKKYHEKAFLNGNLNMT